MFSPIPAANRWNLSVLSIMLSLMLQGCGRTNTDTTPETAKQTQQGPVDGKHADDEPVPTPFPSSPSELARESFDALKRGDTSAFITYFHPAELARFKVFAVDVFENDKPDATINQIRRLLAPIDSEEAASAAKGSDLMTAFVSNSMTGIPDVAEILANANLEILGEIVEEPDKVHVITRTVMPRPQPVSCQKSNGRWYQLLNEETMRLIWGFERREHFRNKNVEIEDVLDGIAMDSIDVIGHVKDGEDEVQVLCRISMKVDDYTFPMLGCYPVRANEPAWDLLDDEAKLAAALRSKWTR